MGCALCNAPLRGRSGAAGRVGADLGHIGADGVLRTETLTGITDASGLIHGETITVTAESQVPTSGDYVADGLYGRGGRIHDSFLGRWPAVQATLINDATRIDASTPSR